MPKDLSSSLRGGENFFFSKYFTILMDYRGKEKLKFLLNWGISNIILTSGVQCNESLFVYIAKWALQQVQLTAVISYKNFFSCNETIQDPLSYLHSNIQYSINYSHDHAVHYSPMTVFIYFITEKLYLFTPSPIRRGENSWPYEVKPWVWGWG